MKSFTRGISIMLVALVAFVLAGCAGGAQVAMKGGPVSAGIGAAAGVGKHGAGFKAAASAEYHQPAPSYRQHRR